MVEVDPLKALSIITALIILVAFICYRIGANRTKKAVTAELQNRFDIEKNRYTSEINTLKEKHIEALSDKELRTKELYLGAPISLEDIKLKFPEDTFTVVDENIYPIRLDKKRTLFCISSSGPLKKGISYKITVEKVVTAIEVK